MAVRLRFRPVLLGPASRPTTVFFLVEEPDGPVSFRDQEIVWPLTVSLAAATADDLPDFYRRRKLDVTIGPLQQVTGDTLVEAHRRMIAALRAQYGELAKADPTTAGPARSA